MEIRSRQQTNNSRIFHMIKLSVAMTTRDNICFRVYLERRQRSRVADVAARLPDNA